MCFRQVKMKMKKKLHSEKGDSIAEVLVALLISALALVMLASMITSSARMITNSKTILNDYYSESAQMNSSTASDGTFDISVKIDSETKSYTVNYYKSKSTGFQKVVSFH